MFSMVFPDNAGIHNGTSSLFSAKGVKARVHLPHGPVINLPFDNASDFMRIMKWRMHDYPQATGNDVVGAEIQVESDTPDKARELIIAGAA